MRERERAEEMKWEGRWGGLNSPSFGQKGRGAGFFQHATSFAQNM